MQNQKLFKMIIYLILVTGAFMPVASYFFMGVLCVLIIIFKQEEYIINFIKKNRVFMLLIFSLFISCVLSELWYISLFFLIAFFLKLILLLTVVLYFSRDDIRNILLVFLVIGIIVSVIGICQTINSNNSIPNWWIDKKIYNITFRAYSTFYNPNILSAFLNLIIVSSIICLEMYKSKDKILYKLTIASLMLSIICEVFTYSRSGWVSLSLTLLVITILDRKYFKYFIFITCLFTLVDYAFDIGRLDIFKASKDSSIRYRFEIWLSSVKIIRDNLLFGIGPGTVWDYIPKYSHSIKAYVSHSHNLYLQILLDIGLIGFTVFLCFITEVFRIAKIIIKLDEVTKTIGMISFAFYISLLVNGIVDVISLQPQISIYLWFLLGINYKIKDTTSVKCKIKLYH